MWGLPSSTTPAATTRKGTGSARSRRSMTSAEVSPVLSADSMRWVITASCSGITRLPAAACCRWVASRPVSSLTKRFHSTSRPCASNRKKGAGRLSMRPRKIPLGLQLFLGALAGRDVADRPDDAHRAAAGVPVGEAPGEHPVEAAVLVGHPVFGLEMRRLAAQVGDHVGPVARAVVRVDELQPLGAGGPHGLAVQAQQRQQAGREVEQLGVRVPVPEALVGAGLGQHVALPGLPPLFVGDREGRAVLDDADPAVDVAGHVPLGGRVDRQQVRLRRQGG